MPSYNLTRGKGLAGHVDSIKATVRSGLVVGSGANSITYVALTGTAAISPANSTVAANSVEERSYTTGLTALGLAAGDIVMINPKTAFASGLGIGSVRVLSANTLHIGWINASGGATAPGPTTYAICAVRLG